MVFCCSLVRKALAPTILLQYEKYQENTEIVIGQFYLNARQMKINAQTKIAALIKQNKDAVEAIVAINPHFKKLRNPVLRKILAPRVTIEDAARIGKCGLGDFFQALTNIGFTVENPVNNESQEKTSQDEMVLNRINSGKIQTIDVRPILNGGTDPFNHIMKAVNKLPDGFVLALVNSFEPTPLIRILNNKGFASLVRTEDGVVKTYFTKSADEVKPVEKEAGLCTALSLKALDIKKIEFGSQCKEIDVRNLEMPLPMVTILNELEALASGEALYVHHKKIPQYLLPELEERKVSVWMAEIEEGNVKLLIHK